MSAVSATDSISCRLCSAVSAYTFSKRLLDRHDVRYFLCGACGALETEPPTWLAEAYQPENERFDTGQVIRSLQNAAFLKMLMETIGLTASTAIDFGCGSGLLVRLLRDQGIDAYGLDAYAVPRLATGFVRTTLAGADVINLCEVAEHFDDPAREFNALFAHDPRLVVMQTAIQNTFSPDWPYLAPEHGQHVFFYSTGAIQVLAQRHGRIAVPLGGFVVFVHPGLAGRVVDLAQGRVHPELEARVGQALPRFLEGLLATGYRYAIEDNQRIAAVP